MPYATNPDDGVRTYYEVEGSGPPLVLVHGFSANLDWWRRHALVAWQQLDFYVGALKNEYQLILFDPRGHGRSDKPHDPSRYTEARKVSDIVGVLDQLDIATSHYLGYSSGAVTGWAFTAYSSDRLRSLTAISGNPFSLPEEQRENEMADAERFQHDGTSWWVEVIEDGFGQMTASAREGMAANDPVALAADALAYAEKPDFTPLVDDLSIPILILGSNLGDQFRRFAESLPDATVVTLDGLNHLEEISRSDLTLPHITAFLERVEKEKAD